MMCDLESRFWTQSSDLESFNIAAVVKKAPRLPCTLYSLRSLISKVKFYAPLQKYSEITYKPPAAQAYGEMKHVW